MKPPVQYAMMPPRVDAPKVGKMKPVQQPKVAKMRGIDEALDYYLGPTGIPDRARAAYSMFNSVDGVLGSMRSSQAMLAPDTPMVDRVRHFGDMLSGVATVVAPVVGVARAGAPAASAVVDAFTGLSTAPATQAAKTTATDFMADEFGGFKAYHGSPHDFDKFSMDKIGTGEGAQAYGHGLYFADSEGVARSYRDALSDPDAVPLRFKDKPVNTPWNADIRERWADEFAGLSEDDADAMEELLGNLSQVNNLADVKNVLDGVSPRAKILYYNRVKKDLVKPDIGPGSMYEVQINADPEAFLDWDKPLNEQPQAVRDWFDSRGITPGFAGNQSGAELMQAENSVLGADGTSAAMREAKIPGIRYLDHGSRFNAADGKPQQSNTRNYVVFDDAMIEILRKYGIAGLMMGGAGMMQPNQAQAGQ